MTGNYYTILTNIGKAKIANSTVLGTKVDLVTMAVGNSNNIPYNPTEEQTTLVNEVWRGNINSVSTDENNPNWIEIYSIIPPANGGFKINEVGIFDNVGDLIAIAKYPETYKPVAEEGSTKDLGIKIILEVSNTTNVTLKVDPTVIIASKKDLLDHANKVASTIQAGHVKLNNTLTSDSATEALTAAQGKALKDDIESQKAENTNELNKKTDKKDYVSNNAFAVTTGTSTTYIATLNPAPTAYTEGMNITIKPHVDCGDNPTLNINGLGAINLCDSEGNPLGAEDLVKDRPYRFTKVGTSFFLANGGGGGNLNIFAQPNMPSKKDGIWIKTPTNKNSSGIVFVEDVFNNNYWGIYETMPTPRREFGCIEHDGKIYCIGGTNDSTQLDTVEIYDIATNSWSIGASMPTARYGFGCVEYEGKIYCIGGYNIVSITTGIVEIYDIASNTWSTRANMPQVRRSFGCVVYGGKIYCIGGWNITFLDKVEIYDIATNSWSAGTSMPTPRHSFGCVEYEGKIYCIGGTGNNGATNIVQIYNILGNSWSNGTDMPTARYYFGCVEYNGKIYCIGGYNGSGIYKIVQIYNILGNSWSNGADMSTSRHGFGCVEYQGKIYCIGGYNGSGVFSLAEIYDITTNTWNNNPFASMPTPRHRFGCVEYQGKIYCMGGANSSGQLSTVEIYDRASNTWSTGANMPSARYDFGCVEYNGKIYCIGGYTSFKEVLIYDIASNTWSIGTPMPTGRGGIGCVEYNGRIYCIGGSDGGTQLSTVEIYDIATNTWSTGANMNAPRWSLGCVEYSGKIYCIGGFYGSSPVNTVYIYNIASNTWSTGNLMPTGRYDFGYVGYSSRIYCISGYDSTNNITNTVLIYDIASNTWSTGTPIPTGRVGLRCARYNGKIYCIGGYNNGYKTQNEVYSFSNYTIKSDSIIIHSILNNLGGNLFKAKLTTYKNKVNNVGIELLKTPFVNAYYKDVKIEFYPSYWGDGTQWNLIK